MENMFQTIEQNKVDTYNTAPVEDDGTEVNCQKCNNRGMIAFLNDAGKFTLTPCKCAGHRRTIARLKQQGLFEAAKEKTLDKFTVTTEAQRGLKEIVQKYIADGNPRWLILCGQSGAGKTHLCTAAFVQISMKQGTDGRYLLWNSDGRRIKAASKDGDESLLNEFKQTSLLYIDDLFKCKKGSEPSDADVRLAFELLDYRYAHKLRTIISTEMPMEDISYLDEAIYRRIRERCGSYIGNVRKDKANCFDPNNNLQGGT